MSSERVLRPLRREEIGAVLAIEEAWPTTPHWTRRQFEEEIGKPHSVFVVCAGRLKKEDAEEAVLGYAGFWRAGPEAQVTNIAVHPGCPGQGIGRMLLDCLIRTASEERLEKITLEVGASNVRARDLYLKAGFKETGRRPGFYGPGEDAILMELFLSSNSKQRKAPESTGKHQKLPERTGKRTAPASKGFAVNFLLLSFAVTFPLLSFGAPQLDDEFETVAVSTAPSSAAYRHYLQGLLFEHQRRYTEALQEYQKTLALDPGAVYVWQSSAEISLELGRIADALKFAKRAVELDPGNPDIIHLLGNVYWAGGDLGSARAVFEKMTVEHSTYSAAFLSLANLLSAVAPEKARPYYERYSVLEPENRAEVYYQLALIEGRLGRPKEALEYLKKLKEADPGHLEGRYGLARSYEVMHETAAALGEYLGLLERDPENLPLLNHIGELHYLMDRVEEAEEYFLKAKEIQPDNPTASLWTALLAEERKDFSAAAERLKGSSLLEQDHRLNLRLSYYLTQAGRVGEAVGVLEKAYGRWPQEADIGYFLALGYSDLDETRKAVSVLEEVSRRRPDSRDVRFQLGALYERLDKIRKAEEQFRWILERNPGDAAALNYLGYALADRGLKLGEAEDLIRRAIALDPKNGAYLDSLGWVYFRQGKSREAVKELRAALEVLSDDETVWDHLGDAYASLSEEVLAWNSWKISQMLKPLQKGLEDKIRRVEKKWSSREQGGRLLDFLTRTHSGAESFSGFCDIKAQVGPQQISFSGAVSYSSSSSRLQLDVLGPFLVPLWTGAVSSEGAFEMGPLPSVEGLSPEAAGEVLFRSLSLLRDLWRGDLFAASEASFHKGWRKSWIETPSRLFYLSQNRLYLSDIQVVAPLRYKVSFSHFKVFKGHPVPGRIHFSGRGFSLTFSFGRFAAEFPELKSFLPPLP